MLITAIYIQPGSDDAEQCVVFDVVGGPKTFMRLWPDRPGRDGTGKLVEWGWVVGDTAVKIWSGDSRDPVAVE
jgi:hypothetical protein